MLLGHDLARGRAAGSPHVPVCNRTHGAHFLVNYTRNVDAVTPAQVQAMAAKYLKLDDMTLVVVDPAVVTLPLAAYSKNAK